MLSANIPHLYIRNGIYYYRNNSVWKSLRTRCKKEAFRKISHILFSTTAAANDSKISPNDILVTPSKAKLSSYDFIIIQPSTYELIKAYLAENRSRWCSR